MSENIYFVAYLGIFYAMLSCKDIELLKYGRHFGRHLGFMHANIKSSQTLPITLIFLHQKTHFDA